MVITADINLKNVGPQAYIPVQAGDIATVQVVGTSAWSAGIVTVRKSNTTTNAGVAYAGTVTASSPLSDPLALSTEYLVIDVTTANGSDAFATVFVHIRNSPIAQVGTD